MAPYGPPSAFPYSACHPIYPLPPHYLCSRPHPLPQPPQPAAPPPRYRSPPPMLPATGMQMSQPKKKTAAELRQESAASKRRWRAGLEPERAREERDKDNARKAKRREALSDEERRQAREKDAERKARKRAAERTAVEIRKRRAIEKAKGKGGRRTDISELLNPS